MSAMYTAFSTMSAQDVLERLVAVVPLPNKHVAIDVTTRNEDGTESLHPTLWLAPTEEDVVVLPDGSEIIECTNHEGFRFGVYLGRPDKRVARRAEIVLRPT